VRRVADIQVREYPTVYIEDAVTEEVRLHAELQGGVVNYVRAEIGPACIELTDFFMEPYYIDRLIVFLREVQKYEE